MSQNNLMYPAVGGLSQTTVQPKDPAQAREPRESGVVETQEFSQILGQTLEKPITQPIQFSAHAKARLASRKVDMGPDQMRKLGEAMEKAAAKGLDDTLILTKDAAFIVSVTDELPMTLEELRHAGPLRAQ